MTKKENFNELLHLVTINTEIEDSLKEELENFIDHEVELLDRKADSSSKAAQAKKAANDSLKNTIVTALQNFNRPVTVTELLTDSSLVGYTNPKITSMLTQMLADKPSKVVRTTEKKRAYYSVA